MSILVISHMFACAWILVHKLQVITESSQSTWLTRLEIQNQDWYVQYIYRCTVGYGDILPTNYLEMLISIVNIIIACGFFGFLLNIIGTIVQKYYSIENEVEQKLNILNYYLKSKQISHNLQYEIREYIEYYIRESESQNEQEEEKILAILSNKLQIKLQKEAFKTILQGSSIFSKYFSPKISQDLIPFIQEYRCSPEEIIIEQHSRDSESWYFIEKGSVECYIDTVNPISKQHSQELIQTLVNNQKKFNYIIYIQNKKKKGQNFGLQEFFTQEPRKFSFKCLEFTVLLVIKRSDFISILSEIEEDYEKFCHIRDKIKNDSDYSLINQRCISCNSVYHQIENCPLVNVTINLIPRSIQKKNYVVEEQVKQKLKEKIRKRKKYNVYYNLFDVQDNQIEFNEEFEKEIEKHDRKIINSSDFFVHKHKTFMNNSRYHKIETANDSDSESANEKNQNDRKDQQLQIEKRDADDDINNNDQLQKQNPLQSNRFMSQIQQQQQQKLQIIDDGQESQKEEQKNIQQEVKANLKNSPIQQSKKIITRISIKNQEKDNILNLIQFQKDINEENRPEQNIKTLNPQKRRISISKFTQMLPAFNTQQKIQEKMSEKSTDMQSQLQQILSELHKVQQKQQNTPLILHDIEHINESKIQNHSNISCLNFFDISKNFQFYYKDGNQYCVLKSLVRYLTFILPKLQKKIQKQQLNKKNNEQNRKKKSRIRSNQTVIQKKIKNLHSQNNESDLSSQNSSQKNFMKNNLNYQDDFVPEDDEINFSVPVTLKKENNKNYSSRHILQSNE